MSEYATNGAMLVCTCGTVPTPLQATSNTLTSVQGQLVATISDKAPMSNIKPFGPCKMKPTLSGYAPCIPVPTLWMGFLASVEFPGGNPLLKTSTIQCACGGLISFQDSGQKKSDRVVINPSSPQLTALQQAAINATPFCEECEKKERKLQPKIIDIFWMDEEGDEPHELYELPEGKEVILCIELEEGGTDEKVDIEILPPEGRTYKGSRAIMEYKSLKVENDNTAYIDHFKIEYDE